VNAIDLLALEVLRVFEHTTYMCLPASKSVLTLRQNSFLEWKREEIAKMIKEIPATAKVNREAVTEIIQELFPQSQWAFSNTHWGSEYLQDWLKDLRVAHPQNFDRYFSITVPDYDISQADLQGLLSLIDDPQKFKSAIFDIKRRRLLDVVIDRISANLDSVPQDKSATFITALFEVGDDLRGKGMKASSLFSVDAALRFSFIIDDVLESEPDQGRRLQLLTVTIDSTTGLFLPLVIVNREKLRHKEPHRHGQPLVSEKQLASLQEACVQKIEKLAGEGYLCQVEFLDFVLGKWSEWGDANKTKQWVINSLDDTKCLLALLVGFLHSATTYGGGLPQVNYYMDLEELEQFVDIKELTERLRKIEKSRLESAQQIAVDTFYRAVDMQAKRKSDYDRWKRHGDKV